MLSDGFTFDLLCEGVHITRLLSHLSCSLMLNIRDKCAEMNHHSAMSTHMEDKLLYVAAATVYCKTTLTSSFFNSTRTKERERLDTMAAYRSSDHAKLCEEKRYARIRTSLLQKP